MKINADNTNLNLRHLRALHAIRATGSFARAADLLGVVPSALTETIRQLEESAGLPLFDRRMRPPQLTPAGEELLAETGPALMALDRALREHLVGVLGEVLRATGTTAVHVTHGLNCFEP